MKIASIAGLLVLFAAAEAHPFQPSGRGFLLAGEPVGFDNRLQPHFSAGQLAASAASTREGLVKWAATAEGRRLISRFRGAEYEIEIVEDASVAGPGRAPRPGLLTMLSSNDRTRVKRYQIVLNPAFAAQYAREGGIALGEPVTPAEVMAAAWAGEMLHIDFYSRAIQLPHHDRADFQRLWFVVALQLGFPNMKHGTEETLGRAAGITSAVRD